MGVTQALQSFVHFLKGKHVKWYSDNQGVVSVIRNGSTTVHLHKLALESF